MVMWMRSKWAAGWGSVSAGRRVGESAYWCIGVRGTKTLLSDTATLSRRVSTKLMTLCKRPHADPPIRFLRGWPTLRLSKKLLIDTSVASEFDRSS